MSKIEEVLALAKREADDPLHGYDQAHRNGPDYDCSSWVNHLWQSVGVPVMDNGATYTGNMREAYLKCGFRDVTDQIYDMTMGAGIRAGDVLLNRVHHTALMGYNGQIWQAGSNEFGGITGGQTGDQTGREIGSVGWYNFPWDCVLRCGEEPGREDALTALPTLKKGDRGAGVAALQGLLLLRGLRLPRYGADGDFGSETEAALLGFQHLAGLTADGVAGTAVWTALTKA